MSMFNFIRQRIFYLILAGILLSLTSSENIGADKQLVLEADPLLTAMSNELRRAQKDLRLTEQPSPYFISFWVQEKASASMSGKYGAVTHSHPDLHPHRTAYVQVRVGSYEFDNTNLPLSSTFNPDDFEDLFEEGDWESCQVPVEGNDASLRAALWLMSDRAYKRAITDYRRKQALQVTTGKRDKINDFSRESPQISIGPAKEVSFDQDTWRDSIRRVTGYLASKPEIMEPTMDVKAERIINYYVNTEGTILRGFEIFYTVDIQAWARTPDGIKIRNFRNFFVRDPKELPDRERLISEAEILYKELIDVCESEEFKPYTGPAVLGPDVAGVFFHEALGHRLEGERQRMPESGQTFKGKIGEKILPEFLSITDDPLMDRYNGRTLAGSYLYDSEGVAAQKVALVEKGVLKNYLLSRTPIEEFNKSNGHGRSQEPSIWRQDRTVGRMANLIVLSEKRLQWQKLKSMLIDEAKRQGKPYGLIIRRVKSGETNTESPRRLYGGAFQAFRTTPVLVYSLNVETGQEKLVRGVELVGTPLISLEKVLATGDDEEIFNGRCGAESGQIPVSVVSPSILTGQVELQRVGGKPKSPPILPSPFR
jgi:TldD protein